MSYAAELFALAIILYLYDSSVLLYVNEALLIREGSGRWAVTSGWRGFVFAGRSLCVLNPLSPQWPAFRLRWNFTEPISESSGRDWPQNAENLRRLAPFTTIGGVALFVILPLGLFTPLSAYAVIPALVALYASTGIALWRIRRSNLLLAGGRTRFWAFAFECAACPPFAVNMIRRIALAERIPESLPAAAARLLDPAHWTALRGELTEHLDQELERVTPDSEQHTALEAQKARLMTLR